MKNKKILFFCFLSFISWNIYAGCDEWYPDDRIWKTLNVNVSNVTIRDRNWNSKTYNLIKDLWLPKFSTFNYVKRGIFENWTLIWPWSLYKSQSSSYYLYTENWQKWWICIPYYLTGHCWQGRDYSTRASSLKRLWRIANGGDDFGLMFYIPFSYINWQIVKKLNIVTSKWHLNWLLDETDVEFNFSFY